MDTTITLSEPIFRAVQAIANERGHTVSETAEDLLSHAVASHSARPRPPLRRPQPPRDPALPGDPGLLTVPVDREVSPYDVRAEAAGSA